MLEKFPPVYSVGSLLTMTILLMGCLCRVRKEARKRGITRPLSYPFAEVSDARLWGKVFVRMLFVYRAGFSLEQVVAP